MQLQNEMMFGLNIVLAEITKVPICMCSSQNTQALADLPDDDQPFYEPITQCHM